MGPLVIACCRLDTGVAAAVSFGMKAETGGTVGSVKRGAGKGMEAQGGGSGGCRGAGRDRRDDVVLAEPDGHSVLLCSGDRAENADAGVPGASERFEAFVGEQEVEPHLCALREGAIRAEVCAAGADVGRLEGNLSFLRRSRQGLDFHRHREIVALEFPAFDHTGSPRRPLWQQSIAQGRKSKMEKSMIFPKKIS